MNKSPKISDFPTHLNSPFDVEVIYREYIPKADEEIVFDRKGDLSILTPLPKSKCRVHDDKPYVKVFKGKAQIKMKLPEPSKRMLEYIIENIGINKDRICIPKSDFLEFAGYKDSNKFAYYSAIEGLLSSEIIARQTGSTHCFFINPNILFNGDRTKLVNIKMYDKVTGEVKQNILEDEDIPYNKE